MEMELRLSNDSPLLPSVRAFVRSTLNELGLPDTTVSGLEQLVDEVIAHTIEHAYPHGEDGAVIVKVTESNGKFEITICDDGVPQDIQKLESELVKGPVDLPGLRNAINTGMLDEMHWSALGPSGKALHLIKWLGGRSVKDSDSPQISEDEPLAPEQDYDVRKSTPEEALQISQLIYCIYGNTYFNEDLYYPDRVAAQHANGTDGGDYVVVINADKIKVTGAKFTDKKYYTHSLYPGGLKTKTFKEMNERFPERIIEEAVKGMLPKNKLGKSMIKKLKVFSGPNHEHESQQPIEWNPTI
jgi:large subunit ribosomal protein L13